MAPSLAESGLHDAAQGRRTLGDHRQEFPLRARVPVGHGVAGFSDSRGLLYVARVSYHAEDSLDTIAHRGNGTVIGAFRCPPHDPRFGDSGPIQNDIFVFPRTSVKIRHAGGPSFVADPTVATVYNRGQIYDRGLVSGEGDRSDWFAVPREVASEAVIANGLEPAANGPFGFAVAPVSHRTYLAQRRLFRRASRGNAGPQFDEEIYAVLDAVVSAAAAAAGVRAHRRIDRDGTAIADQIRRLISARCEESWSLRRLEARLGISAFRLCRVFRQATGSSIHAYLTSVRLRASLERLEARDDELTTVAMDLGFSSHSHFTLAFRRAFGVPPSIWRRTPAGAGL